MEKHDLLKAAGLFFISCCLLGFIFWNVNKSGRLEQTLLDELDELAELDNELCPFDGRLTKTSRVILFDFSDPLPVELNDYPGKLLNNMMSEMQDADRFDRFSLYTLNPYSETPKDINAFCVPVTINQIPGEIRKALWGKDPEQHSKLPARYQRFAEVFERLWENEHELYRAMRKTMDTLTNEVRNRQAYSRIIENVEEIAELEMDRDSRKINIVILSDMLQNSPQYSHYSNSWLFDEYLEKRTHPLLNMERVDFEIYFVQSCESLVTKKRRALQKFWEDYFSSSNAAVKLKLLRINSASCKIESPTKNEITSPATAPPELPDGSNMEEGFTEQNNATDTPEPVVSDVAHTDTSIVNDDVSTSLKKDCPAPELKKRPKLIYPKRARGEALLRYKLYLNAQGRTVDYELYEMDIGSQRYEKMFEESAAKYIQKLLYKVQTDETCTGGLTTKLAIKF